MDRQVAALGEVLAEQAVGVLIRASLPGAARIGEEDAISKELGYLLVAGHLSALVPGQGQSECRWDGEEHSGDRLVEVIRSVAAGEVDQADEAALSLDERADGRAVVPADDQVAFPVAGMRSDEDVAGRRCWRRGW